MNESMDQRLGEFLREDAPPARDVRFRIALVERRQRQIYRRQAWQRQIIFALAAVLPGVVLFVAEQPLVAAALLAAAGGLVMAGIRVGAALQQAWGWASRNLAAQKSR